MNDGYRVIALTLSANAAKQIKVPRTRALELYENYENYSWAMVDFTEWDREINRWILNNLSDELPKSCLLCALSKITAVIPFCQANNIHNLSLGYTDYQSSWAEQTPLAINLQREKLKEKDINLLLPSMIYNNKSDVKNMLIANNLNPDSLENPCCITKWGTQSVPDQQIYKSVNLAFEFLSQNSPVIDLVEVIGSIK